ncbi:hypothetical protein [Devosia sp. CN2-171]|uniref:hypothetical protein n=1 Tax=Devosia sp. CN2-171 TaxID=3400909 RepID=UPI003BF848A3
MSGVIALVAAFLAFSVPIGVPLFVQNWRSFAIVVAAGALFFTWVTFDLANPAGMTQALGPFVFGLALFGFGAGVIAKFVMLLERR